MSEVLKKEYIEVNILKYCVYPKYKSQKIIPELFSIYDEYLNWVQKWSYRFYELRKDPKYKELFDLWKDTRNKSCVDDILELATKYGISKNSFLDDLIADKGENFASQFKSEHKRAYELFQNAIVSDFGLGFFNSKLFGKNDFIHIPRFTQSNEYCVNLVNGTLEAIGKTIYLSEPTVENLKLVIGKGYVIGAKITKHGQIVITMYVDKTFEYDGVFSLYGTDRLQKYYFDNQVNLFKVKMEEE